MLWMFAQVLLGMAAFGVLVFMTAPLCPHDEDETLIDADGQDEEVL